MADTPFGIELPDSTPEFMAPAYFSCLLWALGQDGILSAFQEQTGTEVPAPRSPIEKLVDSATGFDPYSGFVRSFVPWFNQSVWGDPMERVDEHES